MNCAPDASAIRATSVAPDADGRPAHASFMHGVINLRGRVMPVIDLAAPLAGNAGEMSWRSCIPIVGSRAGDAIATFAVEGRKQQ